MSDLNVGDIVKTPGFGAPAETWRVVKISQYRWHPIAGTFKVHVVSHNGVPRKHPKEIASSHCVVVESVLRQGVSSEDK